MKARYEKPLIYIEQFALMQAIAANCGSGLFKEWMTFGDFSTCGYSINDDPGLTIFNLGVGASNCTLPNDQSFDGDFFCYNNPGESMALFSS